MLRAPQDPCVAQDAFARFSHVWEAIVAFGDELEAERDAVSLD
jgi:hypothetical protein